jgi:iron uptake system EfeUOB component EfeO/EfeM
MNVQEFYASVGGDYDTAMRRFKSDERAIKFIGLFKKDKSYSLLLESMEAGNVEEAFRAAHSMKGTVLNVSIADLYEPVSAITEALRASDLEKAKTLLPPVTECYTRVIGQIDQLLQ